MMLRRTLRLRIPPRLRGVFTFDGSPSPSDKTSKGKTPSPLDVDALMAKIQETKAQMSRNGYTRGGTMTKDSRPPGQEVQYRKKLKMGPREKYMFKKMRQRERDRPPQNDPASDLTPLYEITRPWSGFSPLMDRKQKKKTKEATGPEYTEEEQIVIMQIRKTIYNRWEAASDQQPLSTPTTKPPATTAKNASPNFFRSAESAEKESSSPEHRSVMREHMASRLYRAELEKNHEFQKKNTAPTTSDSDVEVEEVKAVEEALKADPTFQHDALRLESVSKHIEDVDTWIDELRSFAAKHERVLEAMQPTEEILTVASSTSDNDALGEMGGALRERMAENGINVDKIERQAEKELQRERRSKKKGHPSRASS